MNVKRPLLLIAMGVTAVVTAIAPAAQAVPPGEGGAYVCGSADQASQPTLTGGVEISTSPCYSFQTSFSVWNPVSTCYAPQNVGRVVHITPQTPWTVRWLAGFCSTGQVWYSNAWPYNEYRYSSVYIGQAGSYFEIYQWAR